MEQELIEKILARAAEGRYEEEIKRARDLYFEQIKDLREDDPSYERLTSCFLNWYVFDRSLDDGSGTPLQLYAREPGRTAEERDLLAAMAANVHSLFEVVRLEEGALALKDLFTLEPIRVTERRRLAGLESGDILEARLLPLNDKLVFSTGAFVLHPRAARAHIYQAVDRSRREGKPSPQELMKRLQALSFRFSDRFRQRVPVVKVYSEIDGTTGPGPSGPASSP